MDPRSGGYSLQELMITLGLIAVLSVTTLPLLRNPSASTAPRRFTLALTQALAQARGLAIASGERITFCGSLDGYSCSRAWSGTTELLIFTDRNEDRVVDPADALHLRQRLELRAASAHWYGSLGRPYLRFRPGGSAIEFGRFSYCPATGDPAAFRQVVINSTGRAYVHHDDAQPGKDCD
jgi:type IV fimbrial biogenesis protein FimT